ncbi:MAG: glycosyl hydrolase family 28-related protein [Chthoniobacterales bacterium]
MTRLNVLDFGAKPDGSREDASCNDEAFATAISSLATTGGTLDIPHGTYYLLRSIALRQVRNIILSGSGGNRGRSGTRLVYVGNDPAGCLHLSTCMHGRFEDICFAAEGAMTEAVVRVDAVEDGPDAVSSLNNVFERCTFQSAADAELCGVSMKDAAHTEFRHCWFRTAQIAARIGAPMRKPRPTISNGQCSNTVFDQCILFGDVIGERGTNVTFQHCEFAELQNGDGAKINFGIGENPHMRNVTIRDCFALNGKSHAGTFFTQGRGGEGLCMTNNRIRGYSVAVKIDGRGGALLAANVFEQVGPGAVDVEIHCTREAVSLLANVHSETLRAGNQAVVDANMA